MKCSTITSVSVNKQAKVCQPWFLKSLKGAVVNWEFPSLNGNYAYSPFKSAINHLLFIIYYFTMFKLLRVWCVDCRYLCLHKNKKYDICYSKRKDHQETGNPLKLILIRKIENLAEATCSPF